MAVKNSVISEKEMNKAVRAIVKLVKKAKNYVIIVSEKLPHEYYQDPRVIKAIEEALEKGIDFNVAVGPKFDKESIFVLTKLPVFIGPVKPNDEFTLGDSKHVRYELKESKGKIKQEVLFNAPKIVEELTNDFIEIKRESRRFYPKTELTERAAN